MLNCFNHQTSRRHLHPPPLRRKATLSRRFRRVTRGRWRAERKRPLALDSSRRSSRLARTRTSSSSCSSSSIFMKFEFADLAHHPSTLIILMNWVKLLHSPSFAQSTTRHTYASLTQNLMELTIYIYKLCVRGKRWRGGKERDKCWVVDEGHKNSGAYEGAADGRLETRAEQRRRRSTKTWRGRNPRWEGRGVSGSLKECFVWFTGGIDTMLWEEEARFYIKMV